MTKLNRMFLLVILAVTPILLFPQQCFYPPLASSKHFKIQDKSPVNVNRVDIEQTVHNSITSIAMIDIDYKKSPFFENVEMGLRYDLPYGGLGFIVQLETRSFFAPNIWIGDDIPHNRFLVRGGLKFYLPLIKIFENSSIYTQVSYGVVTRNMQPDTIITKSGPIRDHWGNPIEPFEGSTVIKKTSYWTSGPSISAGMEYKLSKRFKINAELGMSYVVSGDGDTHDSIYPLLQFGVVNTYW